MTSRMQRCAAAEDCGTWWPALRRAITNSVVEILDASLRWHDNRAIEQSEAIAAQL
jgi:hypothetical protein